MAYEYHTQLSNSFFDSFIAMLSIDGQNKVAIFSDNGVLLAECFFPTKDFVSSRTPVSLHLSATTTTLALDDGTASKGKIFNASGEVVVTFDVGSTTINPLADLILNSVVFYKGGSVTITEIILTV